MHARAKGIEGMITHTTSSPLPFHPQKKQPRHTHRNTNPLTHHTPQSVKNHEPPQTHPRTTSRREGGSPANRARGSPEAWLCRPFYGFVLGPEKEGASCVLVAHGTFLDRAKAYRLRGTVQADLGQIGEALATFGKRKNCIHQPRRKGMRTLGKSNKSRWSPSAM